MSLPTVEPVLPENHETLPPARRRRRQRSIVPPGESDRDNLLASLSTRVVPSFDFFLFSLLSGVILGAALLLDSPALVFLAVLLAPFMAPILGIALGAITGAARFSLQALVSLVISSAIVFSTGMLSGWAAGLLPPTPYLQIAAYSQFTWAGFAVLVLGAGFTTYRIVRSPQQKPLVPSVAIAYSLYIPLGVAGFGVGSGQTGVWVSALELFAIYLAWAILISAVILIALGLRPLRGVGYLMFGMYLIIAVGAFALLQFFQNPAPLPMTALSPSPSVTATTVLPPTVTHTPTATHTPTTIPSPTAPTNTPSITPEPPTPTFTPTRTLIPSRTPTLTLSPAPTPLWARITAKEGNGVLVRAEPSFASNVVQSLLNDTLVEILPETITAEGVTWVKVRTVTEKVGWVVGSLLTTATPSP